MENITQIIKGCIQKDHKYQKIIYDRYRNYALKIVFRYIYRYDAANDVVTDGFVKIFNHFDSFVFDDEANENILLGWIKKIMINTAIDHLRKTNMLPEIGALPEQVWNMTDNNDNADQVALYNELILLIKELPPDYRIVFNLYVIDGYTHSEIAGIMQSTIGTSKSMLSRARSILQQKIRKMEESQACRM